MSPRRPAALRGAGGEGGEGGAGAGADLRGHLIAAAAALIAERGTAGLSVRDIARAARVADGVLYNYFEDKDDLLAHALLAHVAAVMMSAPAPLPEPGSGDVAANLTAFIGSGIDRLARLVPAFAGVFPQPGVLIRFHAMVGGDAAFGVPDGPSGGAAPEDQDQDHNDGERGLPGQLLRYLRAEQGLGRVAAGADVEAATLLIVGAIHGQVLPRVLFSPPGSSMELPPGLAERLVETVLDGIAP